MALTTTTLAAALAVNATSATVASATGLVAGMYGLVEDELVRIQQGYTSGVTIPLLRGQDGTPTGLHPTSANITFFLASDEAGAFPQTVTQFASIKARGFDSYSAAGAIAFPQPGADSVAMINGTGALAMTLAVPTKDLDGSILYIVGNGKAAHTVTAAGGLGAGGANLDLLTFAAGAQNCIAVIAANGVWVPLPSVLAGTLTNITITAS